jgi:hypothetical protein
MHEWHDIDDLTRALGQLWHVAFQASPEEMVMSAISGGAKHRVFSAMHAHSHSG